MFLLRKAAKRALALLLLLGTFYWIYISYYDEPLEFRDNQHKRYLIERAIKSIENDIECQMPDLPINAPEIMQFMKKTTQIKCDPTEAWVYCGIKPTPNLCQINKTIAQKIGSIYCDFSEIIRGEDDYYIYQSSVQRSRDFYVLQNSDFVIAECRTNNNKHEWKGLLTGIRKVAQSNVDYGNELPFNVLMFGFDSMSRNAWIRSLPKTYEYLTKQLHTDVLKGYNIIGDGTPQALIPLLTGFTELELPETRKRIENSAFVNVYPFIFNEYSKHGYVTVFNEDMPHIGTFTYRLNGFKRQPTTHYMRPFYMQFLKEERQHKSFCIGETGRHKVMLDYIEKILAAYDGKIPQFSFSFHGELSHDSINLINAADDDLTEWLKRLKMRHLLDRTILVLMSDHGNRFAEMRKTIQGKLEERLPFFSFTFPELFKKKYPREYQQFRKNLNKLVTPFDVHRTFVDILNIQKNNMNVATTQKESNINYEQFVGAKAANRSMSLFDAIPKNRTCSDAFIEPHWCSCLSIEYVNTSMDSVRRAAHAIVDKINIYTSEQRDICHTLYLKNITWAGLLQPQTGLLRFKQNQDIDGYVGEFVSPIKITKHIYQMQIQVLPGNSMFEASITHNLFTDQFTTDIMTISRVNKYGNQAICIMDKNPDLRKFCYCR